MRAETPRARKEDRVRKRSRQHTVEESSQGREEGEQPAAAPQGSVVSVSPCGGGQCFPPLVLPSLLHVPRAARPGRIRGLPKRGAPELEAGSPRETLASPLHSQVGLGSPQTSPETSCG